MNSKTTLALTITSITLLPEIAMAYVGPGAGISVLGALWGLIVGVVMALGIVLFWPIRMLIRKRKAAAEVKNSEATNSASGTAASDTASEETSDHNP